jgi:two-component system, chemotaxis family, response regulator Rcp1
MFSWLKIALAMCGLRRKPFAKLISTYLHVAADGIEAMAFLRRQGTNAKAPRPDFILLDLNLPRMDGREATSDAEADIVKSYQLQANCYLSKPVQLDAFESLVKSINDFWLIKAKLPQAVDR